jgi:hypothetical protein
MKAAPITPWAMWLCVVCLGCGNDSPRSSAPSVPDAPANIQAVAGVQNAAVSWDAVMGASSYNVYWSLTSGVTKSTGTKVAGLGGSPFQHGPLSGGTYYYVVTANGVGGESADSTEASASVNLVAFATSASGSGDLGGWPQAAGTSGTAAGDAICQTLASAANLAGSFRAWLSDDGTDAYCRIQGLTGKKAANCGQAALPSAAGPWIRMDGAPWAGTIDAVISLDAGAVRAPLLYDETGHGTATGALLITGTIPDGTLASGFTCSNWTSATGNVLLGSPSGIGSYWTYRYSATCGHPSLHLLCLQAGTGPALAAPVPAAGARRAFLTASAGNANLSSWAGAGGKTGAAAGDAICQARAAAAGLANASSFKAWLGVRLPLAKTPAERLTSSGPWARVDGMEITAEGTQPGGEILTGLAVDENGHFVEDAFNGPYVWTGDGSGSGSAQTTCADWTSDMPIDKGWVGEFLESSEQWSSGFQSSCDSVRHLYCFED